LGRWFASSASRIWAGWSKPCLVEFPASPADIIVDALNVQETYLWPFKRETTRRLNFVTEAEKDAQRDSSWEEDMYLTPKIGISLSRSKKGR
jgi:hypothetical protein